MDALIDDTAERVFRDRCDKDVLDAAETGEFPEALWQVVAETGLQLVGSAGSGTGLAELFAVLKVAGSHALPLPLAEIMLGNRILGEDGITTIATDDVAPWARRADRVIRVLHSEAATVATEFDVEPGVNLAGEPRDRVIATSEIAVTDIPPNLAELLALSRVALMSGAMTRVLDLAIGYATQREQFGRPISKFQAIQHNLAVLAGEVAAAQRATDGAIEAVDSPHFTHQVAAAKSRVGEAAGIVAEIAHQVHGAMGFTYEHTLHHFTRRLWSWRDEHGTESEWQARLGSHVASLGADCVWEFITDADAGHPLPARTPT